MWRPTKYGEPDFAAFREAMEASPVEAVIIHAVYLINCATKDKELRKKSLTSLTHALRIGDGIGARGVVLGRAWSFALAARGEAGVAHMLRVIRAELLTAMALTGCTDVNKAGRELLG